MSKPGAIFSWSGGKDSAYCLSQVMKDDQYLVEYLLTTINYETRRVSMHGVHEDMIELQARSIGIPLIKMYTNCGSNVEYEKQMETILLEAKKEGIHHVIFGDIFLKELREYREKNLARVGMQAVFPLWKKDTRSLIGDFVNREFKTVLCCTNDGYLGEEWLGREIDQAFIDELPSYVDPCGENGEYHSYCYAGPIFKKKIDFKKGEVVYKSQEIAGSDDESAPVGVVIKGYWFCDLIPSQV